MTSTPAGTAVGPLLPAGCPRIVGIVNITADSFSDGGRYLDPAAAIAHARRLRADGADIIELGPAASHPDSVPVTAAEEQRRLAPVLGQLAADGIPVAVDSFRPETQRFAISAGAACVNDIHGFGVPGMYPVLAASACRLIVMHCVQPSGAATRVVTDPATVWASIGQFFSPAAGRAAGGRHRPGPAHHRPRARATSWAARPSPPWPPWPESGNSRTTSASPSWSPRPASLSSAHSLVRTSPGPGLRRSPLRSSPHGREPTTSAPTTSPPCATRSPC